MSISSLRNKLNRILLNDWDPLYISDIPEACNEYIRYVDELIILTKTISDKCKIQREIEEYLYIVEKDNMCLSDISMFNIRIVAKKIIEIL